MVVAAAMTCYAAFGLVPLLAIATRIASGVYGSGRVHEVAQALSQYVKGPLKLDSGIVEFARTASEAKWWTLVVAVLPVSLYAEDTVRSLESFSRAPEQHSRSVRGRLLAPIFVGIAVLAALLAAGPVHSLLDNAFGRGVGARLLGILVAFNVLFLPTFISLLLIYRLFATTPLRRGPLAVGAFAAASWMSGQLLGYSLAVRSIGGFASAYGGYAPVGAVAAVAFLVYLEHIVFLLGYLLALVFHERGGAPRRLQ